MMRVDKRLATQIVQTVKDVCEKDINFIDPNGMIFASTCPDRIGQFHEIGYEVSKNSKMIEVDNDNKYEGTHSGVNLPLIHHGQLIAVIGISGNPNEVRKFAYLAIRITKLLIREQELQADSRSKQEKINYIVRNLTMETPSNPLYLKELLNEFHLSKEAFMYVASIRFHSHMNTDNPSVIEADFFKILSSLTLDLFYFEYPNDYILLIPEDKLTTFLMKCQKYTKIYPMVLQIGIGSKEQIGSLNSSYKKSQIARRSLKYRKGSIACFDELDIELLFGEITNSSQKLFTDKILSSISKDDQELLRIYYEEDMSLSKTCDRIFHHKNTLQYKLNKIADLCGYNPRHFRDAVVLYLALIQS